MVLALVLGVLVAANLLNNRLAPSLYVWTCVVATVALLAVTGMTPADVGLVWSSPWWALGCVGVVALCLLVLALVPRTRPAFLDLRVRDARPRSVAHQMLVRLPLGTVLLEEVAFRGVLYSLTGALVSSALFGLWHVLPSLGLRRSNPVAGRISPWLLILAACAAGLVLCELRRRSGSLLAPMALHWSVNALGYLTAYLVTRRTYRAAPSAGRAGPAAD